MDTIPFIKEILSRPALRVVLSDPAEMESPLDADHNSSSFEFFRVILRMHTVDADGIRRFFNYLKNELRKHTEDEKLEAIKYMQVGFRKFGILKRETFERPLTHRGVTWIKKELDSFINGLCGETCNKRELENFINELFSRSRERRKGSQWSSQRAVTRAKRVLDSFIDELASCNYLEQREVEGELEHKVDIDAVMNSLLDIKSIEDLIPDNANSSNCLTNDEKSRALLLITAIPDLRELKDPNKMLLLLLELSTELDDLPEQICKACEGQPQALLLIGSLLSVKPRTYEAWNRVKDDLVEINKIKESNSGASDNHMWHIYTYCYDDLSYFLAPCFLYLACYPLNYEIPARSLTEIWIGEDFFNPQDGETIEETANNYLEQLVQRSLVCVSKRSFSGAIKCCRVRQSIHEFCIKKSHEEQFLVANPSKQESESVDRVAFYNDDKKKYTEGVFYRVTSLLCFDFDMNVWGENMFKSYQYLNVLELRKSAIPQNFFDVILVSQLGYLGLRGSKISEFPKSIGYMEILKTIDVRETNIETLPESLWNIRTLRHVYVNPIPQIKGPPSTANIDDLQILKTVAVPESWLENFPLFLSNLTKLALSNRDNPNSKSNPYWKSISNLLSHMDNLLSMTIIGDIVPSEFIDIRAFSNLETVKSISLEGEWKCRKLFIDHVKFPPNLVKLTLTKSGLKEDPMSTLERLQALKYLRLQEGAYTGKKMVCSANGFPQLQFLEISNLKNLEIWEVKPMAVSQLTTLRVVQCDKLMQIDWSTNGFPQLRFLELSQLKNLEIWKVKPMAVSQLTTLRVQCLKLKNLPNLEHVTDKVIEN